jgi:WD40 repeat protein
MRAILILPVTLFAVAVIYMLANPAGSTVGQAPTTPTPTATPTLAPLPDGLTGKLMYRSSAGELVTLSLPENEVIAREPYKVGDARVPSADGLWHLHQACGDTSCVLSMFGADGAQSSIELTALIDVQWSPKGHTFAFIGALEPLSSPTLFVIAEPASLEPRALHNGEVRAFTWLGDGRLLFTSIDGEMYRASPTGEVESVAQLEPASYLHLSPDGRTVAFTQNDAAGWRLWTVDGYGGALRDLGNMGSDPAGTTPPVEVAPEQKGPMYIGWSPDGSYLAFGGGFEPPYIMTTVNLVTGARVRTEFPHGYPGEIKWSPDGTKIAVSTYDVDRTRHESYVVDPDTGEAKQLLSGCVIVWSHDSRFLAVHGEPDPSISVVDVTTGAQAKVSRDRNDIPISWTE